ANESSKVELSGVTGKARDQVVESLTIIQKALNRKQNQENFGTKGICVSVYQIMDNMLFALIANENLCEQSLDESNSVCLITNESILNSFKEERTDANSCEQQFVVNSQIKTSFEWPCFDSACFKPAVSKNLHVPLYRLWFLSQHYIDCSHELSSVLFYVYEGSGCSTKVLSYLLTATHAQSQIERRRMPQKLNRFSKGRRKAEKGKGAGVSRKSERSLDEAVPGGVGTSSDIVRKINLTSYIYRFAFDFFEVRYLGKGGFKPWFASPVFCYLGVKMALSHDAPRHPWLLGNLLNSILIY
ncbi:MAG: hypothetical protein GY861_16505, partial [bacterium]|nr:hypothetical protein [bacterium]